MPIVFGFSSHRRQMLEAELARFSIEMPPLGAQRVVLLGPLARGRCRPHTGLDLLVVQETTEAFRRRGDFWSTHLRPRVGASFLVYRPSEVAAWAGSDLVLKDAITYGRVIVG